MRQRLTFGSALLALLVVGWNNGAGAQRVAPVAISTTRAPGPRQVETLHASTLTFRVAPASRAEHAAWGALAGAVVGGVVGFLIHQEDHTGESLNAPVLISAGAVLGACVGAIIGVMIPTE